MKSSPSETEFIEGKPLARDDVSEPKRHLALGDTKLDDDPEESSSPIGAIALVAFFASLWVFGGFNIFIAAVGLLVMIFLHELGHFMTARWTGMKATQFFLGFGPTLFSFKRGETTYGVKGIPAGAFVRILGMHNLDPVAAADEPRAYRNASYPRRMLVITAGSMMHFIQAFLLFALLFGVLGETRRLIDDWSIDEVAFVDDADTVQSPAQLAGLAQGDTIISVDGVDVSNWDVLNETVRARPNELVEIVGTKADGTAFSSEVVLTSREGSSVGYLGIRPEFATEGGFLVGIKEFGSVMKSSTIGLPQIFAPKTVATLGTQVADGPGSVDIASDDAQRPSSIIGIVRLANDINPLILLAYVNAFVGLFNLLPLLPLDGGHAVIATYERVREALNRSAHKGQRYYADFSKALPMTYVFILFLGFLFFSTVYLDIFRPVTNG